MLSRLAVAPAGEGPAPGVLHLYSHAFFKALLFLAIGWLACPSAAPRRRRCAAGSGHLCVRPALFVGLLSLAGVPRWSGSSPRSTSSRPPRTVAERPGAAWPGSCSSRWSYRGAHGGLLHAGVAGPDPAHARARRSRSTRREEAGERAPCGAEGRGARFGPAPPAGARAATGRRCSRHGASTRPVSGAPPCGVAAGRPDRRRRRGRLQPAAAPGRVTSAVVGRRCSLLLIVGAGLAVAVRWPRAAATRPSGSARRVAAAFDKGFGVDRVYVALVARPVVALARLVVLLDREVVDAYVAGRRRRHPAGRVGGAARAHRAERLAAGLAWVRRRGRRRPRGGGAVVSLSWPACCSRRRRRASGCSPAGRPRRAPHGSTRSPSSPAS